MKNSKIENLNIRLHKEHAEQLRELATKEGLTVTDYVIYRTLNLKPLVRDEIKTCPLVKKDKKTGKETIYTRKYVVTVKEYLPVESLKNE